MNLVLERGLSYGEKHQLCAVPISSSCCEQVASASKILGSYTLVENKQTKQRLTQEKGIRVRCQPALPRTPGGERRGCVVSPGRGFLLLPPAPRAEPLPWWQTGSRGVIYVAPWPS